MAAAGLGSTDADTRGIYTTEDVQQRSIESLKLLLAAGADINAKDGTRGLTPLHEAARWGWNDVVSFLVDHGANLSAKDNRGMTPVDSAMGKAGGNSRGGQRIDVHEDTAALLRKLMAAPPAVHPPPSRRRLEKPSLRAREQYPPGPAKAGPHVCQVDGTFHQAAEERQPAHQSRTGAKPGPRSRIGCRLRP